MPSLHDSELAKFWLCPSLKMSLSRPTDQCTVPNSRFYFPLFITVSVCPASHNGVKSFMKSHLNFQTSLIWQEIYQISIHSRKYLVKPYLSRNSNTTPFYFWNHRTVKYHRLIGLFWVCAKVFHDSIQRCHLNCILTAMLRLCAVF